MKKFLLFAAAATMAATAMAEVFPKASEVVGDDITPEAYKFNTYGKEFIGLITDACNTNWNMTPNWYKDNYSSQDKTIGDGLIFALGGAFYTNNQSNVDKLAQACKIIDMGGTCGKVLCINFAGSNFATKYKEITGQDLEIADAPAGYQPVLFYHLDHTKVMKYLGVQKDGADYMPLRVRFEMNIYCNEQSREGNYWKAYVNNDQGNVVPKDKNDNTAPDICVNPSEFAYRWCEKSDDPDDAEDDAIYDEGENGGAGEWNPNRWLVYEWDTNVTDDRDSEDTPFNSNIKIKNEIPGAAAPGQDIPAGEFTVLIRNIQVYAPDDVDRDYVYTKRLRTWNQYTVGAPSTGVDEIVADAENAPAVYYNLQGVEVANPENGIYIVRRGSKVTKELVK